MTSSRPARLPATVSSASLPPVIEGDPLRWLWLALLSGLFFIRWWKPTEGTLLGDTLPIAEGWFLALALMGWLGVRGTAWRIRWDGLQVAVCLLVAGHILSGLIVVATSGDRRAAVNLIWEWTSLAVAFPLLRAALSTPQSRREWTIVALAGALTLGAYGLTQRFVFYPQMVAQYERVRQELDDLEATAATGGLADVQRMQKLRSELLANGLSAQMLFGSGRTLLEGRLKHSSEPLGRFALANSFAGLLLVWWAVLLFQTVQTWQNRLATKPVAESAGDGSSGFGPRLFGLLLGMLVIGYCLLLTKSRTAYVGGAISLLVWALGSRWKWKLTRRQMILWGAVAVSGLVALSLIAGMTGGLDRLVLAEAPKSLQYRLEYWWSSLQVIRESPLIGVGPGQFRQHYLAHKLPRSSEEIADPHNLVFDVWANGGLLALVGLAWLTISLIRNLWLPAAKQSLLEPEGLSESAAPPAAIPLARSVAEAGVIPRSAQKIPQRNVSPRNGTLEPDVATVLMSGWSSPIRWGGILSLLLMWLLEGALETQLLLFAAGWGLLIMAVDRLLPGAAIGPVCWTAAGLGLLTHLCGAGGIGMPAILQLLVLVAIFAASGSNLGTEVRLTKWGYWVALTGGLGLFCGGFWTAVQPVEQVQTLLSRAEFAKLPSQREQLYRQAALADPLAAVPEERLAEVLFAKWNSHADPEDADFQRAVERQAAAIERNPLSFHTHRALGMFYDARARQTGRAEDHLIAVREMQTALTRYPNNAELMADAAEVFAAAGDSKLAESTARQALVQDDINHVAGHTDKWLAEKVRQRLEKLSAKHQTPADQP